MNLESIIKEQAVYLKSTRRNIDIAPNIPTEILTRWEKKYKSVLEAGIGDYILVMSYTKTGNFALTGDAMYYDNYLQGGMKVLKYIDVIGVSACPGGLLTMDKVIVKQKNGKELCLDGCIDGISVNKFAEIFTHIIDCAKNHKLVVSKQTVSLYDLPDVLKILYLKVLCNYSYLSDQNIDPDEYNAISSFSVRMEIGSDARKELRDYMNTIDRRTKTGYLIRDIKKETAHEAGQWDALRYSLLQDVLYIHDLHSSNQSWKEDGFIGSLLQALSLKPVQVNTMLQAVYLNNKMLLKNADFKQLKKEWKQLIKSIQYTEEYVPEMYLFCSGSIYGVSTYSGFLKKDDMSEKSINKQRELILQEIIENNQKVQNVLVDDMNYIAEKLDQAMNEGELLKERYKRMLERLKQAQKVRKLDKADREQEMKDLENKQKKERSGHEEKQNCKP